MFKLHSVGSAKTAPLEFYTITDAEAVVIGELLKLSSGKLTVAAATDVPEFIAVGAGTAVEIPVIRITEDMVFETTFSAAATSINVGDKVTTTSGLQATATTTNGVFTITKKLGTASGSKVRGMFRR